MTTKYWIRNLSYIFCHNEIAQQDWNMSNKPLSCQWNDNIIYDTFN